MGFRGKLDSCLNNFTLEVDSPVVSPSTPIHVDVLPMAYQTKRTRHPVRMGCAMKGAPDIPPGSYLAICVEVSTLGCPFGWKGKCGLCSCLLRLG